MKLTNQRWFRETLLLLVISVALGSASYFVHPGIPDYKAFQSESLGMSARVIENYPGAITWVDARDEAAFVERHIEGALHLSEDNYESGFAELVQTWDPERMIIVYCDGGSCHASEAVARRLRDDLGSENVYYLEGGIEAWLVE